MSRARLAVAVRIAATLCAFLLAVIGFGQAYTALHGHPDPLASTAYKALQLIVGQFPADLDNTPLPWTLQIARWALPLLTAWTTLSLAWRQMRNPVRLRWIARNGEHLVIAGEERLAGRLAMAERAKGRAVLLWTDEGNAPWVERLADAGIVHVDAAGGRQGAHTLGLDRAAALLLLWPDDTRNMTLAGAAIEEARDRRPPGDPLPVVARIDDIDLRDSVEQRYAREGDRRSARLRIASLPDVAARGLFLDQPLDRFVPVGTARRLVLCFGFGAVTEYYVLRLLAGAHFRDGRRPYIVVLDPDAPAKEQVFRARRPGADQLSPLLFERAGVNQPSLLPGVLAEAVARHGEPCAVLIDAGDEARSLACAYAAEGWYRDADLPAPPIHVLTAPADEAQLDGSIMPFGVAATLGDAQPLLQDEHDALARAIHEAYLDGQLEGNTPIGARESMHEWDDLPEAVRDDNRLVADCYLLKLRDIGARPGPASDIGFRLDPDEIEDLARAEHDRWMAAKLIGGWSHGAERDDKRKRHPDIVPYDALAASIKALDRDQILLMTRLLPRSGRMPRRLLPVRVEPGAGETSLAAALDRLAALYPDRAPALLGRFDEPAVRAALIAVAGQGMAVQPVLQAYPQTAINGLPPRDRTDARRAIRHADTIFALPREWDNVVVARWLSARADLVLTVAPDGRVAAPWLT